VFLFGFAASAAYIFFTARHIGQASPDTVMGVVLMGLAAWFSIQSGIISYVLKLEQRFREAYAVELSNETTKLLAVGLIWFIGFGTALAGVTSVALGALVAATLAGRLLGQRFARTGIPQQRHDQNSNRILFAQVSPIIPGAIYFSVQGPLIAVLAASFGSVVNVAEVGALGRLSVLIGVIAGFTSTVFLPRLLVISDESLFLKRYLHWWLVILALGGVILLAILFFPAALLFVLGNAYSGLQSELLIAAATSVIGSWANYAWWVNRARGWVKYQPLSIPVMIVGQVLMGVTLDLSATAGPLLFGLGTGLLGLGFQLFINAYSFFVEKK